MTYIRSMFRLFGLILIFIFSLGIKSQNIPFKAKYFNDKKKELKAIVNEIKTGNNALKEKAYFTALDHFFRAHSFNPNNALNNFKIGYCLFHMIGTELDASGILIILRPMCYNHFNILKEPLTLTAL